LGKLKQLYLQATIRIFFLQLCFTSGISTVKSVPNEQLEAAYLPTFKIKSSKIILYY